MPVLRCKQVYFSTDKGWERKCARSYETTETLLICSIKLLGKSDTLGMLQLWPSPLSPTIMSRFLKKTMTKDTSNMIQLSTKSRFTMSTTRSNFCNTRKNSSIIKTALYANWIQISFTEVILTYSNYSICSYTDLTISSHLQGDFNPCVIQKWIWLTKLTNDSSLGESKHLS